VAAHESQPEPQPPTQSPEDGFLAYRQALRNYLRRCLRGRESLIDDLLQETWTRLRRYRSREPIRDVKDYVFRCARNVLYDWREKDVREQQHCESTPGTELERRAEVLSSLWVPDDAEQAIAEEEFDRVFAQLPEQCRIALIHQIRDRWTYKQIAQELRVSEHRVQQLLVRAFNHFRVHYGMRAAESGVEGST